MQMTREEKETTRRGPRRVRVGYRPAAGQPRKYFEQEAPEGWHVSRMLRHEGVYAMTTSFGRDENGKEVNGQNIHLFDEGTEPMVIIDHLNYYEERIDAERMTLNDYLNREVG
jgi:hypothetical protein